MRYFTYFAKTKATPAMLYYDLFVGQLGDEKQDETVRGRDEMRQNTVFVSNSYGMKTEQKQNTITNSYVKTKNYYLTAIFLRSHRIVEIWTASFHVW